MLYADAGNKLQPARRTALGLCKPGNIGTFMIAIEI
jgi:hypothetical protein